MQGKSGTRDARVVLPVHVDAAVLAVRQAAGDAGAWASAQEARVAYLALPLGEVGHVETRQFLNALRAAAADGRIEREVKSFGRGGYKTMVRPKEATR